MAAAAAVAVAVVVDAAGDDVDVDDASESRTMRKRISMARWGRSFDDFVAYCRRSETRIMSKLLQYSFLCIFSSLPN